MTAAPYDSKFYRHHAGGASSSAAVVVPMLLELAPARSVVDVGCGQGYWTKQFLHSGVEDVTGVDGGYVNLAQLAFPREHFVVRDLAQPLQLGRRFDLAISLEVAEHLPPTRAAGFVADLVALAGCIAFSAAIPGQGGTRHLNEQYLSYWIPLFAEHGYTALDAIRPRILGNPAVEWWYQQNLALFAAPGHPLLTRGFAHPADIVHPALFTMRLQQPRLGWLLRKLPGAVVRALAPRRKR